MSRGGEWPWSQKKDPTKLCFLIILSLLPGTKHLLKPCMTWLTQSLLLCQPGTVINSTLLTSVSATWSFHTLHSTLLRNFGCFTKSEQKAQRGKNSLNYDPLFSNWVINKGKFSHLTDVSHNPLIVQWVNSLSQSSAMHTLTYEMEFKGPSLFPHMDSVQCCQEKFWTRAPTNWWD